MQPPKKRAVNVSITQEQDDERMTSNNQSNLLDLALIADQAERIQTPDETTENHDSLPTSRTAASPSNGNTNQQQQQQLIEDNPSSSSLSDASTTAATDIATGSHSNSATATTVTTTTTTTTTNNNDQSTKHSGRSFNERRWNEMFDRLLQFKAKHGHCIVPYHYKDDPQLGRWVRKQRSNKKQKIKITSERIDKLESVGFAWSAYNVGGRGDIMRQMIDDDNNDDNEDDMSSTTRSSSPSSNTDIAFHRLPPQELAAHHEESSYRHNHLSSRNTQHRYERRDDDSHQSSDHSHSTANTPTNLSIENQIMTSRSKDSDGGKIGITGRYLTDSHSHPAHDRPLGMVPVSTSPVMMSNGSINRSHHQYDMRGSFSGISGNNNSMKVAPSAHHSHRHSALGRVAIKNSSAALLRPNEARSSTVPPNNYYISQQHHHHMQRQSFLQNQHQEEQQKHAPPQTSSSQVKKESHQPASQQGPSSQVSTDDLWNIMYKRLLDYKRINKNCNVPYNYQDDVKLVHWVNKQRFKKKQNGLTKEQIEKLESIGFRWNVMQDKWNTMYLRLEQYKKEKGHCYVLKRYKKDPQLGSWCAKQREHKSRLSKDRKDMLDKIGFVWSPTGTWDVLYERINHHKSKSTEGNKDDAEKVDDASKSAHKPFESGASSVSNEQNTDDIKGTVVEDAGDSKGKAVEADPTNQTNSIELDHSDTEWYCMLECLLKFRQTFGHTNVPESYVGKDGSRKLGAWTKSQRLRERELSGEQKQYLDMLGFDFEGDSSAADNLVGTTHSAATKRSKQQKSSKKTLTAKRNAATAFCPSAAATNNQSSLSPSTRRRIEITEDFPSARNSYYPMGLPASSTPLASLPRNHFISQSRGLAGGNVSATSFGYPTGMGHSDTSMLYQALQDRRAAAVAATLPDTYPLEMTRQQQIRRALEIELQKQQEELLIEQRNLQIQSSARLPPPLQVDYNKYQDLYSPHHYHENGADTSRGGGGNGFN